MLEYYHCPLGYCQCRRLDESSEECSSVYSYSDENFQCVCNREGNYSSIHNTAYIGSRGGGAG